MLQNAYVFTAFQNCVVLSIPHRKQDLTHYAHCSARSKMLQATAARSKFSAIVSKGWQSGYEAFSGARRNAKERAVPEHFRAFCSTASKEHDELSPVYGVV
jgi:hypothetical protein